MADADGLIKLGKSGMLPRLLEATELLVPETVYEEAVSAGKRSMHEDAFELERVLGEGGAVMVSEPDETGEQHEERAEALLAEVPSLGAGERAALRVFFAREADAILTDDRAFANLLGREGLRALVPAAAIVLMAEAGKVTVEEAVDALGKLESLVRSDVYQAAMEDLENMVGKEQER